MRRPITLLMKRACYVAILPISMLLLAATLVGTGAPRQEKAVHAPASAFIPIDYSYLILVEARVYGAHGTEITGQFIVDTGSQVSQLFKSSADALGLDVTGQTNSHALGGDRVLQKATIPKLCLGTVCSRELRVQLMPNNPLHSDRQDGGILGTDFFGGHVLTIDYQNRRMALTSRPPLMPGYRSVMTAPIVLIDGFSFVKCELPTLKECNLLVDTASTESVIFGEDSAKFIHLKSVTKTDSMTSAGEHAIKFGPIRG